MILVVRKWNKTQVPIASKWPPYMAAVFKKFWSRRNRTGHSPHKQHYPQASTAATLQTRTSTSTSTSTSTATTTWGPTPKKQSNNLAELPDKWGAMINISLNIGNQLRDGSQSRDPAVLLKFWSFDKNLNLKLFLNGVNCKSTAVWAGCPWKWDDRTRPKALKFSLF